MNINKQIRIKQIIITTWIEYKDRDREKLNYTNVNCTTLIRKEQLAKFISSEKGENRLDDDEEDENCKEIQETRKYKTIITDIPAQ